MVELTFLGSQLSGHSLLHTTHADEKVAAQQVCHVCSVVVTTDNVRHAKLSGMTNHTVSVAS